MAQVQDQPSSTRAVRHLAVSWLASASVAWAFCASAAPGDLDVSFGTGGVVSLEFSEGTVDTLASVATQPDGKVLLVGRITLTGSGQRDILVVRLTESGAPDSTFGGGDGIVTIDISGGFDGGRDAVALADGKIVVGGSTFEPGSPVHFVAARLEEDGDLDATFGSSGIAVLDAGISVNVIKMLVQGDGKIVLAGQTNEDPSGFIFGRLDEAGDPDLTFGNDGIALVELGAPVREFYTLNERPDGKLIAAGSVSIGEFPDNDDDAVVVQLASDGTPDSSFSGDGIVQIDYPSVNNNDLAQALALLVDGRLLVGGVISTLNAPGHSLLVRLESDGERDTTFGAQGARALRLAASDSISAMEPRADGSTVFIAGTSFAWIDQAVGPPVSNREVFVGLVTIDGDLDPSFGVEGVSKLGMGCGSSPQLAVQANGAPVLACRVSSTILRVARVQVGAGEAPGILSITSSATTCESCDSVTLLATRTGGRLGAVSAMYQTVDGSAASGSDFLSMLGTVAWADGEDGAKPISITIHPDNVHEGGEFNDPEDFVVELFDPIGAAPIVHATSQVTIPGDDDGTPGTVAATSGGPATLESTGSATTWVQRIIGSTGAVSVNWQTTSASATSGADFESSSGSLSWADGESGPKAITIPLVDDNAAELGEALIIDITAVSGGVDVRSAYVPIEDDENDLYNDGTGGGVNAGALGTASDAVTVSEDVGTVTIVVERSGGTDGQVTVDYATVSGSAFVGSDFESAGGTLTWADGDGEPEGSRYRHYE